MVLVSSDNYLRQYEEPEVDLYEVEGVLWVLAGVVEFAVVDVEVKREGVTLRLNDLSFAADEVGDLVGSLKDEAGSG